MRKASFAAVVSLMAASCLTAAAEAVRVELAEKPIEPGSIRMIMGLSLRSDPRLAVEGFEHAFRTPGGPTILRRTAADGSPEVFISSGETMEQLIEAGPGLISGTRAFGPARLGKGLPMVSVLVPAQRQGQARSAAGYVYAIPASMLAGTAVIAGKEYGIALIDANLDGDCSDPCVGHMRSGDWFAVDLDGDGRFRIEQSGGEGRALTKLIEIAGRMWTWKIEASTLILEPGSAGIFQVRIEGLGLEAEVYGWSDTVGMFRLSTREDGSFELPDGNAFLYNYTIAKKDWKASGQLSARGRIQSPGQGGERVIKAGLPISPLLEHTAMPDGRISFSGKLLGCGNESFTLSRSGRRAPAPVLVIIGPDGEEAHRASMSFG